MQPQVHATGLADRYLALDVLRGATIAFMIIVNTPGDWGALYWPLAHAPWHGFTPTDLVFPTFLFVVGNAMSFALPRLRSMPAADFYRKVSQRTLLIFAIGWLLNAFPFYSQDAAGGVHWVNPLEVRLPGVLQRIALCYFLAAIILRAWGERGAWLGGAVLLLGYWALMFIFGTAPSPYSLEGNAVLRLDLAVIGAARLYTGEGIPFDPEGLLSTLPATVNVLAGYLAGRYIQAHGNTVATVRTLLLAGLVLLGAGWLWHQGFPINKKIWSSSFVLFSTGWDLLLLGALVALIEIHGYRRWTGLFQVFGRNPLVLYAASNIVITLFWLIPAGELSLQGWLFTNLCASWLPPKAASLLFALGFMLLIWLPGWWLDRRRIYIRV